MTSFERSLAHTAQDKSWWIQWWWTPQVPLSTKHPQTMTHPPPCFTVGIKFLSWNVKFVIVFLCQTCPPFCCLWIQFQTYLSKNIMSKVLFFLLFFLPTLCLAFMSCQNGSKHKYSSLLPFCYFVKFLYNHCFSTECCTHQLM